MPQQTDESYIFKIVLVGDLAVGKTSLVTRFIHNKFRHDYKVTIGVNVMTKALEINGSRITLSIFDLAGQQKFREVQDVFYVGTNGVLFVFDYTRPDTLEGLHKWEEALSRGVKNEMELIGVLIGNKIDLKGELNVDTKKAEQTAFELNCQRFIQTSALTGEQVDDAFYYLAEKLITNANSRESELGE